MKNPERKLSIMNGGDKFFFCYGEKRMRFKEKDSRKKIRVNLKIGHLCRRGVVYELVMFS